MDTIAFLLLSHGRDLTLGPLREGEEDDVFVLSSLLLLLLLIPRCSKTMLDLTADDDNAGWEDDKLLMGNFASILLMSECTSGVVMCLLSSC